MSRRTSHGDGLYLNTKESGTQSWVFVYKFKGKRIERGLGSAKKVSLAQAKKAVRAHRAKLDSGIDPFGIVQVTEAPAFSTVAMDLIESLKSSWRNEKHCKQWESTLRTHAAAIWVKSVAEVSSEDVLATLLPIWSTTPETASRVRGRVERVLDAARVRGLRTGDNPARWKGHMELLLPKRRLTARKHHPAMPYTDVPAFIRTLRSRPALSARALEFLILTAARTSEVIKADASEFNLDEMVWVVPAQRMKAGREHRVPLCSRAAELVRHVLFLNAAKPFGMSNMAMENLLRRMDQDDYTVHGFRSSFRDWVGEETDYPREVAEAALAHQVGDAVEQAYRRGDALAKRRALMNEWATYLEQGQAAT